MTALIYKLYWKAERLLAPGLRYSQSFYEDSLLELVNSQSVWLDVGCGHQVLPPWRCDAERMLVSKAFFVAGIDRDAASLAKHRTIGNTWEGSAEMLPFPDNSFNLVTANMVVEHLPRPSRAFAEIRRILAPEGLFLLHTPNINGYAVSISKGLPNGLKRLAARVLDGRAADDVYPTYYRCNSEKAIIEAASISGLAVRQIRYIPTTATFARILPIAAVELLWIRATMRDSLASYRSNILALLSKAPWARGGDDIETSDGGILGPGTVGFA